MEIKYGFDYLAFYLSSTVWQQIVAMNRQNKNIKWNKLNYTSI